MTRTARPASASAQRTGLFLLLAAIIALTCTACLPAQAYAEGESNAAATTAEASLFSYTELEDGTLQLTAYNGTESDGTNVTVPAQIDGKSVTVIGDELFRDKTFIRSITVPTGITHIGFNAFMNCTALASVKLPDEGLVSIDALAFANCTRLEKIVLHEDLTELEAQAFKGCTSLIEVHAPASLTSIGLDIFNGHASGLTIYGPDGCKMQAYAKNNKISYQTSTLVGRVTCDAYESDASMREGVYFSSVSDLLSAVDQLGKLSLTKTVTVDMYTDWDISAHKHIEVPEGKDYTFNLNGHMINVNKVGLDSDPWTGYGDCDAFRLKKNATLTVNGGSTAKAQAIEHKGRTYTDANSGNTYATFWQYDAQNGDTTLTGGLITGGACDDNSGAGAIAAEEEGAKIYLNDVTLAGNLTDSYTSLGRRDGGAIALHGKNSTLVVNHSNIVHNHSNRQGGGIYVDEEGSTVTITGESHVDSNFAVRCGGGIYTDDKATVTIEGNSTVNGNEGDVDGGGIYINGNESTLNIKNASVGSNHASTGGGGIYLNGNDSTIKIEGSSVDSNVSSKDGGGIYHNGKNGTVTVSGNSSISGNTSTGSGGGIYDYYDGTTFTISDTKINKNTAKERTETFAPTAYGDGGGIFFNDVATLTLDKVEIAENKTEESGGGIASEERLTLKMTDTNIHDNEAAYYGGGISVMMVGSPNFSGEFSNSHVYNNTCSYLGGGVYLDLGSADDAGSLSLTNGSSIHDNKATDTASELFGGRGGGLYVKSNTLNLTSSDGTGKIYNNTAAQKGGGVFGFSAIAIKGLTITGNTAQIGGGGVFIDEVSLVDTTIENNSATETAGGVYANEYSKGSKERYPVNLGGKVVIANNTLNGAASNLAFEYEELLNDHSYDRYLSNVDGNPLTKDSSIGITVLNLPDNTDRQITMDATVYKTLGDDFVNVLYTDNTAEQLKVHDDEQIYIKDDAPTYHLEIVSATTPVDDPEVRRLHWRDTVTLNSASYRKDGQDPAYWELVDADGNKTKITPSDTGIATFSMPKGTATVTAYYKRMLSKIELDGMDISDEWDSLLGHQNTQLCGGTMSDETDAEYKIGDELSLESATEAAISGSTSTEAAKVMTYTITLDASATEDNDLYAPADGTEIACSISSISYFGCSTKLQSCTAQAQGDGSVKITVALELERPTYQVSFKTGEGGSAVVSQQVKRGMTATLPATPTKAGYNFKGWQLNGKDYTFSTPVTDAIELTAVWEKEAVVPTGKYLVKVRGANINNADDSLVAYEYESGNETDSIAEIPTAPAGWRFVSWDTTNLPANAKVLEDGSIRIYNGTENVELTALFEPLLTSAAFNVSVPSPGEAFPAAPYSCTATDASRHDLAQSALEGATVSWKRSDGSAAGTEAAGSTDYTVSITTHLGSSGSYVYALADDFAATINGNKTTVTYDAAAGTQTISCTVKTSADKRFDAVTTDLSDAPIVTVDEYAQYLPQTVEAKLKDGSTVSLGATWNTDAVDTNLQSGSFTVTGEVSYQGETHRISRTFILAELGAPKADTESGSYEGTQHIALSAGSGWDGEGVDATFFYAICDYGTEDSTGAAFAPYAGTVTVSSDATVFAYAKIGNRTTAVGKWDYKITQRHRISVTDGTAYKENGNEVSELAAGYTVTIKADEAPEGKEFAGWKVVSGEVELADAESAETSFTMPDSDVELKATYKDKKKADPDPVDPDDKKDDSADKGDDNDQSGNGDTSDKTVSSATTATSTIGTDKKSDVKELAGTGDNTATATVAFALTGIALGAAGIFLKREN